MPSSSTRERVLTMEAFGAKVTLLETSKYAGIMPKKKPPPGNFICSINLPILIIIKHIIKLPDRKSGEIPANGITHFVSSMGTTGTIMGCSRFFKGTKSKYTNSRMPAYGRIFHTRHKKMAG